MLWCFSVWLKKKRGKNQIWASQSITSLDLASPQITSVSSEELKSVWFNWWAAACHAMSDEKRMRLLWPALNGAVSSRSLGPLSPCCASEQNKIVLFIRINNSSKDTKMNTHTHTQKDTDKNLIRSLDQVVPAFLHGRIFFPACLISSNIGTSRKNRNIKIW